MKHPEQSRKNINLSIKRLPQYIGKCRKVIFQQYSTIIRIKQLIFETFPKYSSF